MNVPLRWLVNSRVSCLHAADAVRRGWTLTESELAAALQEPLRQIEGELIAAEMNVERFWDDVVSRSVSDAGTSSLVEASMKTASDAKPLDGAQVKRITEHLASLEDVTTRYWPRLADELPLRERPMREQWESRGPGMLARLNHLTGGGLTIAAADVALVHPCLGGGGEAHPPFRLVRLEAVLANPWMMLPEPVRLGWLLGQLGMQPPDSSNPSSESRRAITALALIPLALEAGDHVEWCASRPATLDLALSAWRPRLPVGADPPQVAGVLSAWNSDPGRVSQTWGERISDLAARLDVNLETASTGAKPT